MCFVLYIGTDDPLPTIPWQENDPHLNTADLTEHDRAVAKHFSKPYTKYLGSEQGCGCGFRNVSCQDGVWPEEWLIGQEKDYDGTSEAKIHQELHDFVLKRLHDNRTIQLFGCWDGEFELPVVCRDNIEINKLLDHSFFFRERCLYTVRSEKF